MPDEPLKLPEHLLTGLHQLVESLDLHRLNYALIGGLAAGYRSRPRFTKDMDFLLQIPHVVLPSLLDDLHARGFTLDRATALREWTQEHMTVLYFQGVRVDWLKPVLPVYQHIIDQARPESWQDCCIRIATPEGLILLKLLAFRTQDQVDIENLLAANQGQLDLNLIRNEWNSIFPQDDPRRIWLEERIPRFYLPTNG